MKRKLEKFEARFLPVKSLGLVKGGDSNCGTASTNTGGADTDEDTANGVADSDTGDSVPKEKELTSGLG
ncbi:hypothetical protein AAH994_10255 [Weeksellaceae bacterium A-14]